MKLICTSFCNLLWNVLQGDRLEIVVLNADGTRYEYMELRKDWVLPRTILLALTNAENWNFMLYPWVVYQDSSFSDLITVACGLAFDNSNLKNFHLVNRNVAVLLPVLIQINYAVSLFKLSNCVWCSEKQIRVIVKWHSTLLLGVWVRDIGYLCYA